MQQCALKENLISSMMLQKKSATEWTKHSKVSMTALWMNLIFEQKQRMLLMATKFTTTRKMTIKLSQLLKTTAHLTMFTV